MENNSFIPHQDYLLRKLQISPVPPISPMSNFTHVTHFTHEYGKTKSWDYIKSEYNLESSLKYRWIQLTDALPKLWKERILNGI